MYLFDKKMNQVYVYNFTPNPEALKEYRTREMNKAFSWEEMVYRADTSSEPILETRDSVHLANINGKSHTLELDKYKSMIEVGHLLSRYCNGEFTNNRVVKLLNDNYEVVKYLLISHPQYLVKYYSTFSKKCMGDILAIPKSLYLLQMLQQGDFDALNNENIDQQLRLFDLSASPIDQFGYNEFSQANDNFIRAINKSKMILERKLTLDSKKKNK